MEPSELLRFVVQAIERMGLRYFVTGSTVTIFYGEPRFTNDIDIVVDLPETEDRGLAVIIGESEKTTATVSAID